jgi:hypothetical protein
MGDAIPEERSLGYFAINIQEIYCSYFDSKTEDSTPVAGGPQLDEHGKNRA